MAQPLTAVAVPRATAPRRDIAALRVLAIVGVVLIHVTGMTVTRPQLRGTAVWWVAETLNQGTRFCVPLFVMVSGALLLRPGSTQSAGDFYRKRLSRLLPALVAWHLVYLVFTLVVLDRDARPAGVASVLLTGRLYTGLYFFWLILGLYLATPLLARALHGLRGDQVLRTGLVLTAVTCLWDSTLTFVATSSRIDVAASPTVFTYWIPYVGYFVLGAALAGAAVSRRAGGLALLVALGAAAVNTWVASGYAQPDVLRKVLPTDYQGWTVAVLTVSLFVAAVGLLPSHEAPPSWRERTLERAGSLTLGVFAGHLLVLYALQHSGVLTVVNGASRLSELAYLTAGTLVLSFLAAWALSYVPVVRRLV